MGRQDDYFAQVGGDHYFRRNGDSQQEPWEIPGLSENILMWASERGKSGSLCVFGGASGPEAAFFSSSLRGWRIVNIDISKMAIENGQRVFPKLEHINMSLTEKDLASKIGPFDCVILTGILCWIDRSLLSRAILNVDELVKPGGLLGIYDFFPPFPRRNLMAHADNVFTFKQDYAQLFENLGVFRLVAQSFQADGDNSYPVEDRLRGYSMLEKPHY